MRIGHGYDAHKLVLKRKLILGGVEIPYSKGLLGHSDADVLIHAIMDALLGSLALGDIGTLFPDTNNKYKNISSLLLLKEICDLIRKNGYEISNIDSTILAQAPKLKEYIFKMRENISYTCKIPLETISVKATTEEGMGFTGALQGISAHAVCVLEQKIHS